MYLSGEGDIFEFCVLSVDIVRDIPDDDEACVFELIFE